jgi:dihydroorotate dehydrogenase
VEVILENHLDGIIATNTTISRQGVSSLRASELGGLSGRPLRHRSTAKVRQISCLTQGRLPIIAAGGVMNAADVREKLDAGAILVQIYTALVYNGPGLIRQVLSSL